MTRPLAHSAEYQVRRNNHIPAQAYGEHALSVRLMCADLADKMLSYYNGDSKPIRTCIINAAVVHDLGKNSDDNQEVLDGRRKGRMINHVDAGVGLLMKMHRRYGMKFHLLASSLIVEGSHIGILNKKEGKPYGWSYIDCNNVNFLRDERILSKAYGHMDGDDRRIYEYTDSQMEAMLKSHITDMEVEKELTGANVEVCPTLCDGDMRRSALDLRLAASCVYSADHTDTAKHYGGSIITPDSTIPQLQPEKRLALLVECVEKLSRNVKTGKMHRSFRQQMRRKIFEKCMSVSLTKNFYLLNAYVGLAKTLSGMALALRLSAHFGSRHIFYVAPYINIINEVVDLFRNNLLLPDEWKELSSWIVSAHHHLSEYRNQIAKVFNVGWWCPINVTTSAQFFETLASNIPVVLKKLNQLTGSIIIIDEFPNALPVHLWPLAAKWMDNLAKDWGCRFIMMSGSPVNYWDIPNLGMTEIKPHRILTASIHKEMKSLEQKRIKYLRIDKTLSPEQLADKICNDKKKFPKIVISDTIQNAAVNAQLVANNIGQSNVFHISTALCPRDRDSILKSARERLAEFKDTRNGKLVISSTSSLDTGINISARHGYREKCSVISTTQLGGRCGREGEYRNSTVTIFNLDKDHPWVSSNPQFNLSARILDEIFSETHGNLTPDLCSASIEREVAEREVIDKIDEIIRADDELRMGEVRRLFRVIGAWYQSILVDVDLFVKLADRDFNSSVAKKLYLRLINNSFPVFGPKMERDEFKTLKLAEYREEDQEDLYRIDMDEIQIWDGGYDPLFLGYMNEILFQLQVPGVVLANNPASEARIILSAIKTPSIA